MSDQISVVVQYECGTNYLLYFLLFQFDGKFFSFNVLVYASGWYWENIRFDKKWILDALHWANPFWKITLQQSLVIPSTLIKYQVPIDRAFVLFTKLVSRNLYWSMHSYNFWRIYFKSHFIWLLSNVREWRLTTFLLVTSKCSLQSKR